VGRGGNPMGCMTSINVPPVQWKQKETRNYKEIIMKDENVIKTKMGRIQATGFALVYLMVMLYLLSGCGSSHSIPQKECCSSEVTEDKVNLDVIKKDGVMIILPTITTDTIK